MRNRIALLILAVIGAVSLAYGATKLGSLTLTGPLKLWPRTLAQVNALAPSEAGLFISCSDCTRATVCVSSGTGTGAWVIAVASGTFVGSSYAGLAHCQ